MNKPSCTGRTVDDCFPRTWMHHTKPRVTNPRGACVRHPEKSERHRRFRRVNIPGPSFSLGHARKYKYVKAGSLSKLPLVANALFFSSIVLRAINHRPCPAEISLTPNLDRSPVAFPPVNSSTQPSRQLPELQSPSRQPVPLLAPPDSTPYPDNARSTRWPLTCILLRGEWPSPAIYDTLSAVELVGKTGEGASSRSCPTTRAAALDAHSGSSSSSSKLADVRRRVLDGEGKQM